MHVVSNQFQVLVLQVSFIFGWVTMKIEGSIRKVTLPLLLLTQIVIGNMSLQTPVFVLRFAL